MNSYRVEIEWKMANAANPMGRPYRALRVGVPLTCQMVLSVRRKGESGGAHSPSLR